MTSLNNASYAGHLEVVKLLLADERADVNQAYKVRVWEGRVGGESGQGGRSGAVQKVVCVTAVGGRSSHQQGGECEGSRAVHTSIGVRGSSRGGRQCHERTAAREAERGWEGRSGVVLGWR